mmetsp:Transcript_18301/g.38650  ORF Transcript_18301/g.38650 Transcript_18301/m.38650 type:complete len:80 (-) Transcript_18301:109-348(-)
MNHAEGKYSTAGTAGCTITRDFGDIVKSEMATVHKANFRVRIAENPSRIERPSQICCQLIPFSRLLSQEYLTYPEPSLG